jgi:murein DD-endopeptidase MepM/ murein hydrolase activator NlpD
MAQDKEFYAFIVAPSATSKLRKVRISHKLIRVSLIAVAAILLLSLFGLFRLAQHAALEYRLAAVMSENEQLRRENESVHANYDRLNNRLTSASDLVQSLAREINHERAPGAGSEVGQGGPEAPDNIDVPDLSRRLEDLEHEIRQMTDSYRDEKLKLGTIPSGWPVDGLLTDRFGVRSNPFGGGGTEGHEGQDIAAAFGSPVAATADGLVVYAAARSGYGNVIVIYHGNGITTRYGHLSQISVESGQRIRRGDEIGKVGSTGRSTGPHCHYEVRLNNVPVDPQQYAQ